MKLVALLIDERPEEVTDFRRNTNATVFASSNDYGEDNHIRVATHRVRVQPAPSSSRATTS